MVMSWENEFGNMKTRRLVCRHEHGWYRTFTVFFSLDVAKQNEVRRIQPLNSSNFHNVLVKKYLTN